MIYAWFVLGVLFLFVLGGIGSSLAQIAHAWNHWMAQSFPVEEVQDEAGDAPGEAE